MKNIVFSLSLISAFIFLGLVSPVAKAQAQQSTTPTNPTQGPVACGIELQVGTNAQLARAMAKTR